MNRGLVLRFVASATLGATVAVGTGVVAAGPRIVSTAGSGPAVALTGESGNPVAFQLQPAAPVPLEPPPATATIELTTFHAPTPSPAPGGGVDPAWWSSSVPRITPVTQFDGGPLQGFNCLMASGAMLARLAFGIVTSGSQLRSLQEDQEGGTNHGNLQSAMGRGWGIRFQTGALTPLQLRALLYAGAGAVVGGIYGELPLELRLSKTFTGAHSVYIDAFRPPGPDGPAAYYVIDPIGPTWLGYRGGWWPARDVERFATALFANRIYTAWAFPGGVVPADHPVLPPHAYPESDSPGASPGSSPVASPGAGASGDPQPSFPLPSGFPPGDPMPTDDLPLHEDPPVGEPPGNPPRFPDFHFEANVFELLQPGVRDCLSERRPAGCPPGIVGVIDIQGSTDALPSRPPPGAAIDFLYASAVAPETYQLIVEPPSGSSASVWFWDSDAGGELRAASVEPALLDGRQVGIATIRLDAGRTYSFVASAAGEGVRSVSRVGTVTVEP